MRSPSGEKNAQLVRPAQTREERRAILDEVLAEGAAKALPGPPAERSQDFLYGDEGMPA